MRPKLSFQSLMRKWLDLSYSKLTVSQHPPNLKSREDSTQNQLKEHLNLYV